MIKINNQIVNNNGRIINISNSVIEIDGKIISLDSNQKIFNIEITGDLEKITCDIVNNFSISGNVSGDVQTTNGDITIGGDVRDVKTTNGDIEIKGSVKGNVKTVNGDISHK